MVPDKFNMVDMGGIDLIAMQGEAVPGLYDKLVESIAQCRYQCLYNWMFDGVIIPPTYVQLEVNDNDEVVINEGVTVDENDVVHIYSLEPQPIDPVIDELSVTENGTYLVPEGVDGYNPVVVNVPQPQPVIQPLSVIENGTYTAGENVDGYSPVVVNVPQPQPVIQSLSVTENGTYTAGENVDGYSPVVVNVSGGSSILVAPYIENVKGGYVGGGRWFYDGSTNSPCDVYEVEAGKHYIAALTTPVGNRFRVMFSTTDISTATSDVQGFLVGYDENDPSAYASKPGYTPSANGYIIIGKTNQSQDSIKTYLLELELI